ncbi:MAG: FHA domain-containing protein [bacterium]
MPRLILRRKTEIVSEYIISKLSVTIGSSDDNDIVINDQPISLRHCEIFEVEGKYFVKDSKSAFGTYVNNKRVNQSEIHYEDAVTFSNSYFDILFYPVIQEKKPLPDNIKQRYFLLAIHGNLFGKKYELKTGETKIGREEEFNDIVISSKVDTSVSRRHATIKSEEEKFDISDKRSRNRTFVNQKVVGENDTLSVKLGDEILIGHNIFRLVKEGTEDYSAPKKAGIFLDRYKMPALKMLTGIIVLFLLSVMMYSTYRILVIKNVPSKLNVSTANWSPNISLTDTSLFDKGEYDISPSLALGTRNGSKNKSIIICTSNGAINIADPRTGNALWPKEFLIPDGIDSSPISADINNDNIDDVIICAKDSRLYIIDGQKGDLIYKSTILGGLLRSTPACADINGDNVKDVVCCSEDGVVLFVYNPSTAPRDFIKDLGSKINSSPVICKYPSTNRYLVAIPMADGKVYFFDGINREYKMLDTAEGINKRKGTSLTSNDIGNVPIIADLNRDGNLEIVVASKQYFVASFDIKSNNLQWEFSITPMMTGEFPTRYASIVASDMNDDKYLDVIVAWPNGFVYVLDGRDGKLLWKQQTDGWNRLLATPAVADLNKDGFSEVVIGGENGQIYIYNGNAALGIEIDRVIKKDKISSNPLNSTPIIADIDNNGYLDIMFKDIMNKLVILKTNSRVLPNTIVWAMHHRDASNSGLYPVRTFLWLFVAINLLSIVLLTALAAVIIIIKKRKGIKKPPVIALKEEVTA